MNPSVWAQALIVIVGVVHAMAAYAYFSRGKHAWIWALGWLTTASVAAWLLPKAPLLAGAAMASAVVGWTLWWMSLRALPKREWIAENARQATGQLQGKTMHLRDVRNVHWDTATTGDVQWEDTSVQLDHLSHVDLLASTWGEPRIAHLMVSFGFDDGSEPIAFSIETRRETDESWSALAGFMKAFELIIVAAREGDVVHVRSQLRGETVHRYRMVTTPAMRQRLLRRYVYEMNTLAQRPRYYNTLTANCTTEVARIVRATGRRLPWNWALVASGLVPAYFHKIGLIDNSQPFGDIQAQGQIKARTEEPMGLLGVHGSGGVVTQAKS